MAKLIGNAPNQVPTNADLGSMAFEDRTNYITKGASVHQPYRNIIINGDMSIAQRGTSATGLTGSTYSTVDRFKFSISGQGTWTETQDSDVPSGQGFAKSMKFACTTADASPAASDYIFLNTGFEGQNLQYLKKGTANAESLTLSFWVKSNKTGTYIAELYDFDNTRAISKSYTISSADTWEKKTLTYAGDTTGTLDNDNAMSMRVNFWFGAGSTWSGGGDLATSWTSITNANRVVGQVNLADNTSNYINITGVQLEAGTTASDFEFLPHDVNIDRCYRYYQKSYNYSTAPGTNTLSGIRTTSCHAGSSTTGYIAGDLRWNTDMRTAPTVTSYDKGGNSGFCSRLKTGVSRSDSQSIVIGSISEKSAQLETYSGTDANGIDIHYEANAEL